MTDTVFVRDIEVECLIGTDADERLGRQLLLIDVDIECDTRKAGRSDRLDEALDYVRVHEITMECADANRRHLLEALAEDLVAALLARLPTAEAVRLRIVKPHALPGVPSVGIEIHRRRGNVA